MTSDVRHRMIHRICPEMNLLTIRRNALFLLAKSRDVACNKISSVFDICVAKEKQTCSRNQKFKRNFVLNSLVSTLSNGTTNDTSVRSLKF